MRYFYSTTLNGQSIKNEKSLHSKNGLFLTRVRGNCQVTAETAHRHTNRCLCVFGACYKCVYFLIHP